MDINFTGNNNNNTPTKNGAAPQTQVKQQKPFAPLGN